MVSSRSARRAWRARWDDGPLGRGPSWPAGMTARCAQPVVARSDDGPLCRARRAARESRAGRVLMMAGACPRVPCPRVPTTAGRARESRARES